MLRVASAWTECREAGVPVRRVEEAAAAAIFDGLLERLAALGDQDVAIVGGFVFVKCGATTAHELKGNAEVVVGTKLEGGVPACGTEPVAAVVRALCLVENAAGKATHELDARVLRGRRRSSMRHSEVEAPVADEGVVRFLGCAVTATGAESVVVRSKRCELDSDGRSTLRDLRGLFGAEVVGGRATYALDRSEGTIDVAWLGEESCAAFGAPPSRIESAVLELSVGSAGRCVATATDDDFAEWRRMDARKTGKEDLGDVSPLDELRRIAAIGRTSPEDGASSSSSFAYEDLWASVEAICESRRRGGHEARARGWRRPRPMDFADDLWPVLLEAALRGGGTAQRLVDDVVAFVAAGKVLPELFPCQEGGAAILRTLGKALAAASAARYGASDDAAKAAAYCEVARAAAAIRAGGADEAIADVGRALLRRDLRQYLGGDDGDDDDDDDDDARKKKAYYASGKTTTKNKADLATADLATVVDAVEVALRATSSGASEAQAKTMGLAVLARPDRVSCELGGLDWTARSSLTSPHAWDVKLHAEGLRATARFSTVKESRCCAPLHASMPPLDAMRRAAEALARYDERTRHQVLRSLAGTQGPKEFFAKKNNRPTPSSDVVVVVEPLLLLAARRTIHLF